ncbi:MAG: dihydrodipicolinate reductase [Thaumarchaeota archaeon]|nr:dihydrodipicolinate reductase [Nitrososphaerota archaeon]
MKTILKKWKVISFGLGPIGSAIAKLAFSRKDQLEIIGAVDPNPEFVGKDLSEVAGISEKTGIKISSNGRNYYHEADVVLHATSSFLSTAESQLLEICENGVDVVSTNEELSYPWYSHKEIAARIDATAKQKGVSVLATGVNPGFVMDALAITLSGVCAKVSEIRATRILDATKRRIPFQKKVGIGLTAAEFEENVQTGKFGHIGLPESIAMVCDSLGRRVDRIEQHISPKITDIAISTDHFGIVSPGHVIGLIQDGEGFSGGRKVAQYHIEMYAGANDPYDEIELLGEPNIKLQIPGGTPGDIATTAIVVNSIPRAIEAQPGLWTIKDLRPASSVLA